MSPVSDRGCNKVCCWQKPGVERAPKQTLFGGVGSLHNMWGCDSCGSVVYLVRGDQMLQEICGVTLGAGWVQ
jgi:hypothetical protein